jgi:hypothetical protein
MTVISRSDSDGNIYDVWAQEQANSCAVASIWMARNQAFQMTINEQEWDLAWRMYGQVVQQLKLIPSPPAPVSLDPTKFPADQNSFQDMFASAGTFMNQVTQKLILDGLRVTSTTGWSSPGAAVVDTRKLSETTPAIVLLGWYGGSTTRSGGHFIVASRVTTSGKVVYLNPWEGRLHELGAGPTFPGGGLFEQIAYISA